MPTMNERRLRGLAMLSLLLAGCCREESSTPFTVSVSKDTTRITKPLKENGEVDYVAAVRQIRTEGVTPKNNLVVTIYRAMGPTTIALNGGSE